MSETKIEIVEETPQKEATQIVQSPSQLSFPQTPVVADESVMFQPIIAKTPLVYARLQANVPFEEIYNSPERLKFPLPDLVTLNNPLSVTSFKKFQRTLYGTTPNVSSLSFS